MVDGFVWIVIGRRPGEDPYIVRVCATAIRADRVAARWLRRWPDGHVDVQRYAVDG